MKQSPGTIANMTETRRPDVTAEFLLAFASEPWVPIADLARRCGLSDVTAAALTKRIEQRYQPVVEKVRDISGKEMLRKLDQKTHMLVDAIDQDTIDNTAGAKGGLKDIAIAFGILAEKRQLLQGRPTQILSVEERVNLSAVLPSLIKEAQRRGLTVDLNAGEFSVDDGTSTPRVVAPDKMQDAGLSATVRKLQRQRARGILPAGS